MCNVKLRRTREGENSNSSGKCLDIVMAAIHEERRGSSLRALRDRKNLASPKKCSGKFLVSNLTPVYY